MNSLTSAQTKPSIGGSAVGAYYDGGQVPSKQKIGTSNIISRQNLKTHSTKALVNTKEQTRIGSEKIQ